MTIFILSTILKIVIEVETFYLNELCLFFVSNSKIHVSNFRSFICDYKSIWLRNFSEMSYTAHQFILFWIYWHDLLLNLLETLCQVFE